MEHEFSMKELYDVFLKTTYPLEIAGRHFEADETLCVFDKVQIANFKELKSFTSAKGGFDNRDLIFWEHSKGITLELSQGIFNPLQFALLCNARMIYQEKEEQVLLPHREETESDELGKITFSKKPEGRYFIYNKETGEQLTYEVVDETSVIIKPYTSVILDYRYAYSGGAKKLMIGRGLTNTYLKLEGKTRVKDDISGATRTGVITIPKIKLMSDLSMRLGENASPVVANFSFLGLPDGDRNTSKVMTLQFLNDDIDSDM